MRRRRVRPPARSGGRGAVRSSRGGAAARRDSAAGSLVEAPSQAGRLVELVRRVGLEKIVFEAESTAHHVWLFNTFGPEVNLGPNIDLDLVVKLEPTRRTLSREGGYGWLIDRRPH